MTSTADDLSNITLSTYLSSREAPSLVDPACPPASASASHQAEFRKATESRNAVCVVLAAGQGSRFIAPIPKVIHPFMGSPLLSYAVQAANDASLPAIVIVGHEREAVCRTLAEHLSSRSDGEAVAHKMAFVVQHEQMGTGHAVYLSKYALPEDYDGDIVILYADNPGVDTNLVGSLLTQHSNFKRSIGDKYQAMIVTGSRAFAGAGADAYGRIVRSQKGCGPIIDIVEKKTIKQIASGKGKRTYGDVTWTAEELDDIDEFNSGIVVARASAYFKTLGSMYASRTKVDPPKFEYYATDFVKGMVEQGYVVEGWTLEADEMWKLEGSNTLDELQELESKHRQRVQLLSNSSEREAEPSAEPAEDPLEKTQTDALQKSPKIDATAEANGKHIPSNGSDLSCVKDDSAMKNAGDDAIAVGIWSDASTADTANECSNIAQSASEPTAKKQRVDEC